ncbi:phage head-tail connector protein [Faecalibaculum rodentium]|jgi:hypothetical protein|uniref:Uncharacterized protein n=1 Tax=Faecalibaculum rodentium TaxID=1702221 RepID=A0A140DVF5_9FIRM|nr:hypothetical protein [Faecalibaculum rodentium]AMK54632.1 hypothetical protein AALO17_14980 [Faecalibaculum rodentium]
MMEVKTILPKVKAAMRIKASTLYDSELEMYIKAVLDDLDRLSISLEDVDKVAHLCILKTKGYFGNSDPGPKDIWQRMYHDTLRQTYLDGRRYHDAV